MQPRFDVTLPQSSQYWEACARHQNRSTTRRISSFFLCDACAQRFTTECFNNRPPIYHGYADGVSFEGYCAFCAKRGQVTLRQWFVCAICENVVLSYPKTIVASQQVHQFWNDRVCQQQQHLHLEELDVVQVEPFVAARRKQVTKALSLESLDFSVLDKKLGQSVFFIELKTGPSPLTGTGALAEFQLDVNDYNDIAMVMRKTGLPVYVFHAQVVDEYCLPTRRSVGKGLWWTDIFSLRSALKKVAKRRGEDKFAGYYRPNVFRPIATFEQELVQKGYNRLRETLLEGGIADLPR